MKTFDRANMPETIKYNNKVYYYLSGAHEKKNVIAAFCKSEGLKMIGVNILSARLKHRTDLHNQPYRPSQFIFTSPQSTETQKRELSDRILKAQQFSETINNY